MTFAFTVSGERRDVVGLVAAELDRVVEKSPALADSRTSMLSIVEIQLALLPERSDMTVVITCSGWQAYVGAPSRGALMDASFAVHVGFMYRK